MSNYDLSDEHMKTLYTAHPEESIRQGRIKHWNKFIEAHDVRATSEMLNDAVQAAAKVRLDHRGAWPLRYARLDTALRDVVVASGVEVEASSVRPVEDLVVNEDVRALIERFNFLRDSGVCSPTTRGLLDEAERLLTSGWADTHGKA